MARKTKVHLRRKDITGNRQSLYLDYYPQIISPDTGKLTRRKFLDLFVYKPVNVIERKTKKIEIYNLDFAENDRCLLHNKRALEEAEQEVQNERNRLSKREVYSEYEEGILRERKLKRELEEKSFLDYFSDLANKRKATNYDNWISALKHLQVFGKGQIKFGQLNEKYCEEFKEYLFTAHSNRSKKEKLSNNTVLSYFNKFKAALKQAYKDKYLPDDLNSRVDTVKPKETRINFLTVEELNDLVKTSCEVPILKRAALLSALTGLRFSDVAKLTWGEVEYIKDNGFFLKFEQQKTEGEEFMPISLQAYELLGKPGDPDEKVFTGLVYSAWLNSQLKIWLLNAGIKKKITFHCFRHTFATLQLSKKTDIYTVSKMLGHKDLKTTQRYAKVIDQTKREAAGKIILDI